MALVVALGPLACERTSAAPGEARAAVAAPGPDVDTAAGDAGDRAAARAPARRVPTHIDSIFTPEEQLRRFREGLPAADALSGASGDLQGLGERFAAAVLAADTADLRRMEVSRAEFAYLYFPFSRFARPPMRQDPALTWFLIRQNGEKGITRVLRRFGGRPDAFEYRGLECPEPPEIEGANRLHRGCRLRIRWPDGAEESVVWFGSVLERDARFKLVSFANDL